MRVTVDGCMGPQEVDIPDLPRKTSAFQHWLASGGPTRPLPDYVYIASSWRNPYQIAVVTALRGLLGKDRVYDFRNPADGKTGFNWSDIDPDWLFWTPRDWREALKHPIAQAGFALDKGAMDRADVGVLVLPCGRSAHLEAGYMAGQGKPVFTLALEPQEPELMTLLLGPPSHILSGMDELFEALNCPK